MHDTMPHPHEDAHPHLDARADENAHNHNHDHGEGGAPEHAHDGPHAHTHDVGHVHTDDGAHEHAHQQEKAPDNLDNLILDIGADTGALVINAAADRDQAEIEISPVGEQARSHNIVRRREAPSGIVYAAVFPAVRAGDYVVWGDASTPAGTVTIHGGRVATFRLA